MPIKMMNCSKCGKVTPHSEYPVTEWYCLCCGNENRLQEPRGKPVKPKRPEPKQPDKLALV